jgi:nucleotide-binding universal stress UspA family protein
MQRILVALDFSEHSDRALDQAIEFAKQFGASLELLHVFDLPIPIVNPYEIAIPPGYVQEAEESARNKLEERKHRAEECKIEARCHLSTAPVSPAICEAAEKHDVDLVVIGTHGYTGLRHALLGSVAERVVRNASCPVLTCK